MQVPHDAMVVVADGRKLLMLRNQGDAEYLNLEVVRKELHANPKDSDQKTDSSGRSSSTQSGPGAPAVAQGGSMHAQGGGAQFAPARGTMGATGQGSDRSSGARHRKGTAGSLNVAAGELALRPPPTHE